MKAMVLTGIRQMEMVDVPDPSPVKDTDVLLRMAAVGVCGSDVHYYTTGRIGSQVVQYPFTVGHECAGVVESVGKSVKRLKPGDRVAVEPARPCFACDQCLAGRINTCRNLKFLGTPGQGDGCLSEFLVMPETNCLPVADSTSTACAALIEPLSIGIYSVGQSIPMSGARIGILGCGPIGLSVLLPAKVQQAEKIYITDKLDYRVDAAKAAGATWGSNPDKEDIVAAIAELEPLGLDAVFECCGRQDALDQAIELLKPGGTLVLVGIPEVDRISFVIDKMRRKEIRLQNIRRQAHCAEAAITMIESGEVDVNFMATHHFAFAESKAAFDLVDNYADGVIKAIIDFD